ncbi:MAG: homoserine dehydrogenase [Armatimonadota bacterium]|nr:homoserine dehydrogenase [bacterium]MDW8320111.1 homoserine dehydrogenase [Armatimonadota bacterium]
MNKEVIHLGILGLGVVGSGTVEVLRRNHESIARKVGARLEIRRIAVRDVNKPRLVPVERSLLTDNVYEVIDDPQIDIVVELIGGVHPAKEYVLRALDNGKPVVSANKELLAKEGADIMMAAGKRRLDFAFEGSVGGGIPIIQPMKNALAGNRIERVMGIVNGTTNYILTRMAEDGTDFDRALKEAQSQGYAEADPSADVSGHDAQYKIAILASIAFTARVKIDDVYCEGIARITAADIEWAKQLGYAIKLVAIAQEVSAKAVQVRVHPALLPLSHPLASVRDVYNAIMVRGDAVGDVMFYGRGAGSLPTGSAVVGDIIDVSRNLLFGSTGRVGCTCFDQRRVVPMEQVETSYYVRMRVQDRPNVLAQVAGVFGAHNISISSVVQRQTSPQEAEIVWITHRAQEGAVRHATAEIQRLPVVMEVCNTIRVEV